MAQTVDIRTSYILEANFDWLSLSTKHPHLYSERHTITVRFQLLENQKGETIRFSFLCHLDRMSTNRTYGKLPFRSSLKFAQSIFGPIPHHLPRGPCSVSKRNRIEGDFVLPPMSFLQAIWGKVRVGIPE